MSNEIRALTEQERKERARYLREWRARNRDKVKAYNRDYWRRKTAKAHKQQESKEGVTDAEKTI